MSYFPSIPNIIGHRGAAADAPENTLLSLYTAHRQGARMVEFDVKLTGGTAPELVLFHDETLDRTTNGTGLIRAYDYADLVHLDAGQGEKIPTLIDVIALLDRLDMAANIEIKPCPGRAEETAAATIEILKKHWPTHKAWPILSSFDLDALATCHRLLPDYPRGLLIGPYRPEWRDLIQKLAVRTLHIGHRNTDDAQMQDYIATGLPVLVYTVNDPARAHHLWALGVQAVFTDCPAHIAELSPTYAA